VKKIAIAAIGAASAMSLAILPSLAHAATPATATETHADFRCTPKSNPAYAEGDWFASSAYGNDYPSNTRIIIWFYWSSSTQGAGTRKDDAETTTGSGGVWSSDTFFEPPLGSMGGDEELRVAVDRASNGANLGSTSLYNVSYNACAPISYSPKQ
jgi:hypothetical protein